MTISSTTVRNSYSGDGSTTAFNYTFKIFENSDLEVILRTDSTGSETVQTITTHYTMTGAGNANGGTVTFVTAPASGITVVLRRAIPQTQAIDYIANDPFPAESHEEGLDRSMMAIQQLQEEVNRTIKFSKTNDFNSNAEDAGTFTVGQTTRSGKILAFDENGDISVTQEIGTYQGTDTTTTTSNYNVRDLIKSTSTNELNNVYICTADSVAGDLLTDTDHFELIIDAVTAATSATNAADSATDAETAQTAAEAAQSAAETAESNAATSESNASTSETNASTSETNAANSATAAANSATSASTSATTATTKASEASTSATNAATSETNAATSETNAATSASNASTSETNAATSASNASTSETNAATSATNASNAQTAAEAAQAAAELAADNFDDTYLGAKASDPTVDNDGDALSNGDLYFNTTTNQLKVYNGSSWQIAAVDATNLATNGFSIAMAIAL